MSNGKPPKKGNYDFEAFVNKILYDKKFAHEIVNAENVDTLVEAVEQMGIEATPQICQALTTMLENKEELINNVKGLQNAMNKTPEGVG